jgi:type II secretory pathway pseudopilin PulG
MISLGHSSKPPRVASQAFTLAEVMIAATVLLLGIVSAITTLQRGMQASDTARNLSLATQLMQSEMERLRLKSWGQLEELQHSGVTTVPLDSTAGRSASRFACTRTITNLKDDMKEILLTAEWRGYDGRPHTARLVTRYGHYGLNDYVSTSH